LKAANDALSDKHAKRNAQIIAMYQAGETLEHIGAVFHCSTRTVNAVAQAAGLSRRLTRGPIYSGPRCLRCTFPTGGDNAPLLDVAKRFGLCDDCVLRVQAGEWCEEGELSDDKWRAVHDAALDPKQVKAVQARITQELMTVELDAA
jgi:hypothetical protein